MSLVDKLVHKFRTDGVITEQDEEIVTFGLDNLINLISCIGILICIGSIFGSWKDGAFFFLLFFPLRKYAGGYHSDTKMKCVLSSVIILFSVFSTYCVSGNMKSNQIPFRQRSKENIIEEMTMLKIEHGINDIVFYDDCFFSNIIKLKDDVSEFCNKLLGTQLNIQWQIEMRPDFFILLSIDELSLLRQAGCRQINIGIEKVSRNGLRFLGKTGNLEGLKEKIALARENIGIKISATFILGGAEEDEDDIKQLVEYAKGLSLDFAHFNPLFVYPGTPLYDKMFKNKREWVDIILRDDLPWGEIVYENEKLSREKLLRLIDYAYMEFYKDTSLAHEQMIEDRFNIKRAKGD